MASTATAGSFFLISFVKDTRGGQCKLKFEWGWLTQLHHSSTEFGPMRADNNPTSDLRFCYPDRREKWPKKKIWDNQGYCCGANFSRFATLSNFDEHRTNKTWTHFLWLNIQSPRSAAHYKVIMRKHISPKKIMCSIKRNMLKFSMAEYSINTWSTAHYCNDKKAHKSKTFPDSPARPESTTQYPPHPSLAWKQRQVIQDNNGPARRERIIADGRGGGGHVIFQRFV